MSSVGVKRDRPAAVEAAVGRWAAELHRRPEVVRVVWFGSRVAGIPTPGSDVDLCVVLRSSTKPWRERIPDYLPGAFPVGVDLFPFTEEELERLRGESPGWHAAIARGREV